MDRQHVAAGQKAIEDRRNPTGITELKFESRPNRPIPDHQQAGITDSIHVDRAASIATVQVDVAITHPFLGDLRVTLISPQGTAVPLFGRIAPVVDGTDNLINRFSTENVPGLAALSGESATGITSAIAAN